MGYHGHLKILLPLDVPIHHIFYSVAVALKFTVHEFNYSKRDTENFNKNDNSIMTNRISYSGINYNDCSFSTSDYHKS